MNRINHIDCSELAFDLFLQLRGIPGPRQEMRDFLGMSSAAEDDVTFSTHLQRPFNWHFYNNRGAVGDHALVPGHRTSERRYRSLLEKLDKYIKKCSEKPGRHSLEDVIEATGRIMHHVQDMSTPSHTIPVYHGPGLADHYESAIESYAGRLKIRVKEGKIATNEDDRLFIDISRDEIAAAIARTLDSDQGERPLLGLYESSAQATLAIIRQESVDLLCDGRRQACPLCQFWREHPADGGEGESFWVKILSEGFGCYGPLGNTFGKASFSVGTAFYEGIPEEYLRLYKTFIKKAAIESLVVLEFVARTSDIFTNPAIISEALSWN